MTSTQGIDITDWLTEQVAGFLDTDPGEIDHDRPLADYGLDSVYALSLCGEIEDTFDIEVEPTLAWDYPTISALTAHLTTQIAEARG